MYQGVNTSIFLNKNKYRIFFYPIYRRYRYSMKILLNPTPMEH